MPTPSSRHVAHLDEVRATSATNRELAAALGVTPRSIRYGIADALLLGLVGVERRAPVPGVDPSGRTITLAGARTWRHVRHRNMVEAPPPSPRLALPSLTCSR